MVKTSKYAVALLLLSASAYADGPYTRSVLRVSPGSSSGAATSPGGATTNVQYNNNGVFAGDSGLTYISSTGTITPNLYGVNTSITASNTQVMYVSGTRMDGALGLVYDNVSNRVTIGTPTGATPTFGDTLRVSGTTTLTGNAATGNISATNISASGNADVTGTLTVTGKTSVGNISATSGAGITGNLQVTGTITGTGNAQLGGFLGVGQAANTASLSVAGNISATGLTISGTASAVSISTAGSLDLIGSAAGGTRINQVRNGGGGGTWYTQVGSNGTSPFYQVGNGTSLVGQFSTTGLLVGASVLSVGPSSTLHVSGTMLVTGQVSMTGLSTVAPNGDACIVGNGGLVSSSSVSCGLSDPRAKYAEKPLELVLPRLMQLDVLSYYFNKDYANANQNNMAGGRQIGAFAYDARGFHGMQALFPELVANNGEYRGIPTKSIDEKHLVFVAIKAIQELEKKIEQQQSQIDALRAGVPEGHTWKLW